MVPRKRTREEEGPEEGSSRRVRVRHPRDARGKGGVDMGPLLQDILSAPPEQTWIMQQMWATHTAMELELRLLRQSAEYVFDRVFWVPYNEWRGEQGSEQGETQGEEEERRALEEAREGEEEARE